MEEDRKREGIGGQGMYLKKRLSVAKGVGSHCPTKTSMDEVIANRW